MARRRHEPGATRSRDRKPTKAQAHATKQFYALIVMLVLILVFAVGAAILLFTGKSGQDTPPSTENNLFAVETVSVDGNTKYRQEAVIGESGVLVGQSIFSVNSNDIEAHLLKTFPYYETVEVQTLHMKEVRITVTETDVVGVMYAKGHWIPIGANGKVLDKQEITSDRPRNALYIKATLPDAEPQIGDVALEDFNASVLRTILSSIEQYGLTDIIEVDLTDLTDIRMNWRGQIEILLGNSTNLEHEIKVVAKTIPELLEMRGQQVSGVLNLTSYSNELDNQAVFSPASSLTTSTTAQRQPASGETTTTTAPPEEDTWYDESGEDEYYEEDTWSEESSGEDTWYDESGDYDDSSYDESTEE